MNLNADIISLFIFALILAVFLYYRRKRLETHSIAFPLIYMCLYKTRIGLALMDKIAGKYRELIKFVSMCFIGVAFAGLIAISIGIIAQLIQFLFVPEVTDAGFRLVLPGISIPGIGYLSFWHWIISIFILAAVHEFAHGVVARAHNIPVKSSGFAFLGIIAPIIPAAFVEPDEKVLSKKSDIVQYSVFSAGPIINLVLALIIILAVPSIANPNGVTGYEEKFTEPIGFSVNIIDPAYPAAKAGIENGTIITNVEGKEVTDANSLASILSCKKPGDTIIIGSDKKTYNITTIAHPDDEDSAYMGVFIQNERRIKQGYESSSKIFYWFKDLLRWLFLLNFFIGLANLLPIFITDGARMLQVLMLKLIKDQKRAMKTWKFINTLFAVMIIFGIAASYLGNLF